MALFGLGLGARRRRWQRRETSPPLHRYLSCPLPDPREDYREAEYVVIDLETTGLDPRRDAIVSLGYVLVREGAVELSSARYRLVRAEQPVAQSAAVHGITDDQLVDAHPLAAVLEELLEELAGRVLVAHHAALELAFLGRACRTQLGGPLVVRASDTLALAARRLQRQGGVREGELRLYALRERYGLPRYAAHGALTDALATAELFLALTAEMEGEGKLPLRHLLR